MIPRKIPRALVLALLAAALLMAASALDLETTVVLDVLSGKVTWSVAGTTLSAPLEVSEVSGFAVTTHAGIFPTGTRSLLTRTGGGDVTNWPVARLSSPRADGSAPVGDWWVDAVIPEKEVFATEAALGSDFSIEASFTGRYHQHTTIRLAGSPGIRCSFRRGLINNDLHILDESGRVVVSGSLDPRLGDRLAAIAATMLRAVGGGLLLSALWWALCSRSRTAMPKAQNLKLDRLGLAIIVISAAAAAALSAWTAADVLEGLPHLPDEVVYRMQSEFILSGGLAGDRPVCSQHFKIPFTYFRGNRWVGHYPPAWPLILTPGVAFGIPWLVPVALRFVHVFLVGLLGCRIAGRWAGIGAALLATTSPLATLLFASTMPHAGSATLLLLCLALVFSGDCNRSNLRFLATGLAFGAAFAIRPLTAVAFGAPLGFFILQSAASDRGRTRNVGWILAGALAAVIPALVANAYLTGSPWHFPYSLAEGPMVSPGHLMFGIRNVDAIFASLGPLLGGWGWPWLSGTALLVLSLAFAGIPFLSGSATREEKLLLAISVCVLASNIVARAHGLHAFGPRYAFAACAPLWILTVCGVRLLARLERRRLPAAAVVLGMLIASAAVTAPARLSRYRSYNDVDGVLGDRAADLPPCSIVLLPQDDWRGWAHATPWIDPDADETPLFALDLGDNVELEWCFPDRRQYRWRDDRLQPAD